jgi:hypothetical protein
VAAGRPAARSRSEHLRFALERSYRSIETTHIEVNTEPQRCTKLPSATGTRGNEQRRTALTARRRPGDRGPASAREGATAFGLIATRPPRVGRRCAELGADRPSAYDILQRFVAARVVLALRREGRPTDRYRRLRAIHQHRASTLPFGAMARVAPNAAVCFGERIDLHQPQKLTHTVQDVACAFVGATARLLPLTTRRCVHHSQGGHPRARSKRAARRAPPVSRRMPSSIRERGQGLVRARRATGHPTKR